MMSIEICNGYSKCTFIIEKTDFVDIHNRVSIDTILTLKSSDDIKNYFPDFIFYLNTLKNLILSYLNINFVRNNLKH